MFVAYAQENSAIEMPPTNGGPGFILPDSPLFFLDQLKQDVRVALSFSPEQRAKTYAQVANERLAELRIMLSRNDLKGARVALDGVYDNFELAANELENARFAGKVASTTAKEMANLMREHLRSLDAVEQQATGVLAKQIEVAQESILTSKKLVAKSLAPKDFAEEIRYDYYRGQTVVLGEKTVVPQQVIPDVRTTHEPIFQPAVATDSPIISPSE